MLIKKKACLSIFNWKWARFVAVSSNFKLKMKTICFTGYSTIKMFLLRLGFNHKKSPKPIRNLAFSLFWGLVRIISWSIAYWAFQAYNPNCWSSYRFFYFQSLIKMKFERSWKQKTRHFHAGFFLWPRKDSNLKPPQP